MVQYEVDDEDDEPQATGPDPDMAMNAGDPAFDGEQVRRSLRVPEALAGRRLDQGLAQLLPSWSRARLQRWVRDGAVTVDGAPARPRDRLLGGERLEIDARIEREERWAPQAIRFDVLHEDPDLIVLVKPAGLVVHPGAGNPDGTLVNGLLHRFPELAMVPRAGIVHRLDKDTSGLLAVARSLPAHGALVDQLASRTMGREYLAVVEGAPTGGFSVDARIGRDPHNRLRMAVTPSGREAVTHVAVEARFRVHTLLACRLETGRTHQIRVHLRHMGHPIVGDALYGARGRLPTAPTEALLDAIRDFRRQALHARRLTLVHPHSGDRLRFEAPIPPDLEALLAALADDAGRADASS